MNKQELTHAYCKFRVKLKGHYYQYAQPNDKMPSVKRRRNTRAANAFAALIPIDCRDVNLHLRLANENLMIPEDIISMPKLVRICTCSLCSSVELEILFQNGRSAFFLSKLGLKQRFCPCVLIIMIIK